MEKRNICLTITQIRSHVNFGNNLREVKAKKVRFYFVTLKWHRSTCYVNRAILTGDLVDVTTLLLFQMVLSYAWAWCATKLCFCLCWSFTAQSTTRSCRAGQLIVALFLGRLRPSKRLTSTKRGRPRQ